MHPEIASSPGRLRLSNGIVSVGIPTAYGPRIAEYGFVDGPNVFGDGAGAERETPRGMWRAYGGHRLWVAPERFPDSYTIDDRPPAIERRDDRRVTLHRARDPETGLRATLGVELQAEGTDVVVRHGIVNEGATPQRIAAWGITVVRAGGVAVLPNPEFRPQREALLPVATIATWRYTDLGDARLAFGRRFIRLRSDPHCAAPLKIGVACERGWFAYVRDGIAFVVRASYDPHAHYPDLGSSAEVYVEGASCEVETLGPLATVRPGEAARHVVRWSLLRVDADDDETLARVLRRHVGE